MKKVFIITLIHFVIIISTFAFIQIPQKNFNGKSKQFDSKLSVLQYKQLDALTFSNEVIGDPQSTVERDKHLISLLQWEIVNHVGKSSMNDEIQWLLRQNDNFLLSFLRSGGCVSSYDFQANITKSEQWTNALRILRSLSDLDDQILCDDSIEQRLAIAIALTFSNPVYAFAYSVREPIDPIDRYKHFLLAFQQRELFPSFGNLNAWQMRYVVGSWATNEELSWGRHQMKNQFQDVDSIRRMIDDVKYSLYSNGIYHNDPQFYGHRALTLAVIEDYGGNELTLAYYGAALAQAHGIPSVIIEVDGNIRPLFLNGDGNWEDIDWGNCRKVDGIQIPYDGEPWMLAVMNEAQNDMTNYIKSENIRLFAMKRALTGEETRHDLLRLASSVCPSNLAAWNDRIALYYQSFTSSKRNDASRLWFGSNHKGWRRQKEASLISFQKPVRVSHEKILRSNLATVIHERTHHPVSSLSTAWLEIDLLQVCNIESIRLAWCDCYDSRIRIMSSLDGNHFYPLLYHHDETVKGHRYSNIIPDIISDVRYVRIEFQPFNSQSVMLSNLEVYGTVKDFSSFNAIQQSITTLISLDQTHHSHYLSYLHRQINEYEASRLFNSTENLNLLYLKCQLYKKICALNPYNLQYWSQRIAQCLAPEHSMELKLRLWLGTSDEKTIDNDYNSWDRKSSIISWLKPVYVSGDHEHYLLNQPSIITAILPHDDNTNDYGWLSMRSNEWILIDLEEICIVDYIKIKWWRLAYSKKYDILTSVDGKTFEIQITHKEALKHPKKINDESILIGIQTEFRYIKFELHDGNDDLFNWNNQIKYGIQAITIYGKPVTYSFNSIVKRSIIDSFYDFETNLKTKSIINQLFQSINQICPLRTNILSSLCQSYPIIAKCLSTVNDVTTTKVGKYNVTTPILISTSQSSHNSFIILDIDLEKSHAIENIQILWRWNAPTTMTVLTSHDNKRYDIQYHMNNAIIHPNPYQMNGWTIFPALQQSYRYIRLEFHYDSSLLPLLSSVGISLIQMNSVDNKAIFLSSMNSHVKIIKSMSYVLSFGFVSSVMIYGIISQSRYRDLFLKSFLMLRNLF